MSENMLEMAHHILLEKFAKALKEPDCEDDLFFTNTIKAVFEMRLVKEHEFRNTWAMSRLTLERWKAGESFPHSALRPRIFKWLREKTLEKIASLEN